MGTKTGEKVAAAADCRGETARATREAILRAIDSGEMEILLDRIRKKRRKDDDADGVQRPE